MEHRVSKSLKIILSVVLGLVLLIVVALGAGLLLIQPNNFKSQLIAAVKQKTGRDLVIDGDLKLAFFPTLALTTGKMSLSNARGFQPAQFASLEDCQINVELLPLLSKKIEIKRIVLIGLTLNLARNQQGQTNWDDLSAKKTPSSTSAAQQITSVATVGTVAALNAYSIGAITIENGLVNWQDTQAGKNIVVKNLTMNTESVQFNQPVETAWSFIMVDTDSNINQAVKFNTLLTVNEKLDTVSLERSRLQTTMTGDHVPNKSLISTLTLATGYYSKPEQKFKLQGIELNADDLNINITADMAGEQINNKPALQATINIAEFNPTKLIKEFALPAPTMAQDNFNKLALSFHIAATPDSLAIENLVLNIDDSTAKGTLGIKNFALPALNFDLAIDSLDMDRYLPPVDKQKKSITTPTMALTAGTAAIPVETLRKLNIDGQLAVAKLKINDLNLQNIQFHLKAKDGLISSKQTIKQFYQGDYTGNLTVDARTAQPTLSLDEKMTQVQIEPLLQDYKGKAVLRGTLDASAQLQGQGSTAAALKSTLQGGVKFVCKDGAVLGFSVQNMIDKGNALLKGTNVNTDSQQGETPFVILSGSAAIQNGVINNQDLLAKTIKFQVDGKGSANLHTEALDYQLAARTLKAAATPTESEQLGKTPIIINVGGTFSNPEYNVDVSAVIEKNKAKLENALEKLNSDETKAKIDHAMEKLTPEEQEKVKKLAPKVGKLLKKLF
jgi:AsmA protein